MALTSADKLYRALESGRRGGVYFLFGEEEFLKEEAAAAITAAHLDPATRDFNYDQLRGATTEPETVVAIAQTPPLMAEWRVVVVRDVHSLAANARGRSALEALLEQPIPGLALVLLATLPDRSKAQIYDRLKRAGTAVEFPTLTNADLPGWVSVRARARGIELDNAAARALAAAKGADLGVLVQELAKLADFAGERKRITIEDVEAVVGAVPRQNRWDWFDLVGDARFREARAGLAVLLDGAETGVGLIIGLGNHFLRLGVAAAGGETALAEALPPHQRWLAQRIAKQARRWNTAAIDAAIDDLLRADRLLKSSSLDERQVMEELIIRLEERSGRRAA
jgi:DNA polymerase-3 subunit delta